MQFKSLSLAALTLSILGTATAASYDPATMANAATPGTAPIVNEAMLAPVAASAMPANKNHFYAGAGAGGISMSNIWTNEAGTKFTDTISDTTYTVDFGNTLTVDAGNIGWNSDFFAGYAWYLPKRTYLGLEAFGNIVNTAASTTEQPGVVYTDDGSDYFTFSRNLSVSLTLQNVFGARLLPGYQVTQNTVVYGIIGWARAHATTSADYTLETNEESDHIVFPGASISGDYAFNGYQLGLGSQINLSEHFAIRGDMIYTAYNNVTLQNGEDVDPDSSVNTMTVTSELTTLEADISLVYMF